MSEPMRNLLAASRFTAACLLGPEYHFPDRLVGAIGLTPAGERLRDLATARFPDTSASDVYAALLALFSRGGDILVDPAASSGEELLGMLGGEVRERRINFPFVFGRELADRFVAEYGAEPIALMDKAQSVALAAVTSQGVYHIDHWVTGPFGILRAAGHRHLAPQTCGPAIRCRDIACATLHHVTMQTSDTDADEVYQYLRKTAPATNPELSQRLIDIEIPDEGYYRMNHPGGLPWLLGNGLTEDEVVGVMVRALNENLGDLWRVVKANLDPVHGSAPENVTAGLSLAEKLQLLLTLSDEDLVRAIESAIDSGAVELSRTEVRRSFENRHLHSGAFRVDAEASHLGVRFVPKDAAGPLPILTLIKKVFSDGYQADLAWQLRNSSEGVDALDRLEALLVTGDPRAVLHQLLFSSPGALERGFEHLRYGRFDRPSGAAEEQALLDRILWKLGNPLPAPPSAHSPLMSRVGDVKAACLERHADPDHHVNAVRGAAVNMFVALEELLTLTVDYCCWALLNDHYGDHPFERFRYSPKRAASYSRPLLEAAAAQRESGPGFDGSRRNTLAPLVSALRLIADLCEQRLGESDKYLRPHWQTPTYAQYSDVQEFPLRHTALFLDLRESSRERLVGSLRAAALALTRTDISQIRNQVTHFSDALSDDGLLAATDAIQDTVRALVEEGLLANVHQYAGEETDSLNRRRIRMADGSGTQVHLHAPHQLDSLGLPTYAEPQLILRSALFEGSRQPVRFAVPSDSRWTELWHEAGLIQSWLMRADEEPEQA